MAAPNQYQPSEKLQPYVHHYLVMESEHERVNRILPGTQLVMAFRFKGQVSYVEHNQSKKLSATMVSGLRKTGRLVKYHNSTGNILVVFKEAAAQALFHEPLYELFEETVSLDLLTGYKNVNVLEEELSRASTHTERLQHIEHFLLARLRQHPPDPLVLSALQHIHNTKGIMRIKELASALCISQDVFEKRFRRQVGVSPKQFSSIVRMQSVIQSGFTKETLAETVFNAGYFDLPHFNKEFKLFTGLTPTDFMRSPVFW